MDCGVLVFLSFVLGRLGGFFCTFFVSYVLSFVGKQDRDEVYHEAITENQYLPFFSHQCLVRGSYVVVHDLSGIVYADNHEQAFFHFHSSIR